MRIDDCEKVFDDLAEEEKFLITALPFRVGIYVSRADIIGGIEADHGERAVLEAILLDFTQDRPKAPFLQFIMDKTVRARPQWTQWEEGVDGVLGEVGIIMHALSPHLTYREMRGFQTGLMDIALSVARAFDESAARAAKRRPPLFSLSFGPAQKKGEAAISRREAFVLKKLWAALNI